MGPTHNNQNSPGGPKNGGGGSVKVTTQDSYEQVKLLVGHSQLVEMLLLSHLRFAQCD